MLEKLMEVEASIFGPKCHCHAKEKEDLKIVLNRYKHWFSMVAAWQRKRKT